MNVLIVVPPLVGHVNPTVGLGAELSRRGHAVTWCGHGGLLDRLLPADAARVALDLGALDRELLALRDRGLGLRGAAAFQFLWRDLLVPLAHAMLPGVQAAVESTRPDVLVVDHQAYAGALVARRAGLPYLTSASTSASLVDPFGPMLGQLRTWTEDLLRQLQVDAGLEPVEDGLISPTGVLAWTTRALVGDAPLPPSTHLVGPAVAARPAPVDFPWEALQAGRRKVLVTLGTVSPDAGERFFALAAEATRRLDVQAILVAPPALVPEPPPGAIVRPFVPQLDLLGHVHAVVCHGGHNTVVEALAQGLPLVVAPIRDDQPVIAEQVARAGAGLRVKFGRVSAEGLSEALGRVLQEPAFREGAARVRASFQAAGGVGSAADAVEAAG